MKKITYTIGIAFTLLTTSNAIAQQGFGTNRPEKSAAVEIKSVNKGLLIPRVSLKSISDTSTINNPVNSLIVFNLNKTTNLTEGYYYYSTDKTKWIPLLDGNNLVDGSGTKVNINSNGTLRIDLGGELLDDAIIKVNGHNLKVQGLSKITDLTDHVIAVGHKQDGTVKVADIKDVVTQGIENELTSTGNFMTSVVNGDSSTAKIINTNELRTDSATATTLISTINGEEARIDLEDLVQAGQIRYDVKSSDASVAITKADSSTTDNLITYDLKVTGVNAGIDVGNGITKDSATQKVILGGELDRNTTIHTKGNEVRIQGLSPVDNMDGQVVAVGGATDGLLKVATPTQIVAAGIKAENGVKLDTATGSNVVKLGGPLLEPTAINTTDTNTLAITGLKEYTGATKNVIVVEANGVLRTTNIDFANAMKTVTSVGNPHNLTTADETILADASNGNVQISLPAPMDGNKGKRFYIKLIKTNAEETNEVIIVAANGGSIDFATTPISSSSPYQSWIFQSNGDEGYVIVGH